MRKAIVAFGLVLAILIAPLLGQSVLARYRRWQATKLLSTIREFRPGETTEKQACLELVRFAAYEQRSHREFQGRISHGISYQFYNSPEWSGQVALFLEFLPLRITLPWTLFSVHLDFVDGVLASIHIIEMQEDLPGAPHPNSASVTILTNRLGTMPKSTPADFSGFAEYSRRTHHLDLDGKMTKVNCCHARFITLDERATPSQRSQAVNFQLHCLTSYLPCKDDREILP
jgi:hypothetical protein